MFYEGLYLTIEYPDGERKIVCFKKHTPSLQNEALSYMDFVLSAIENTNLAVDDFEYFETEADLYIVSFLEKYYHFRQGLYMINNDNEIVEKTKVFEILNIYYYKKEFCVACAEFEIKSFDEFYQKYEINKKTNEDIKIFNFKTLTNFQTFEAVMSNKTMKTFLILK